MRTSTACAAFINEVHRRARELDIPATGAVEFEVTEQEFAKSLGVSFRETSALRSLSLKCDRIKCHGENLIFAPPFIASWPSACCSVWTFWVPVCVLDERISPRRKFAWTLGTKFLSGKHEGETVEGVLESDPEYVRWFFERYASADVDIPLYCALHAERVAPGSREPFIEWLEEYLDQPWMSQQEGEGPFYQGFAAGKAALATAILDELDGGASA